MWEQKWAGDSPAWQGILSRVPPRGSRVHVSLMRLRVLEDSASSSAVLPGLEGSCEGHGRLSTVGTVGHRTPWEWVGYSAGGAAVPSHAGPRAAVPGQRTSRQEAAVHTLLLSGEPWPVDTGQHGWAPLGLAGSGV